MTRQVRSTAIGNSKLPTFEDCAKKLSCPLQIVLVDQLNGPADIVLDIVARLYAGSVSISRTGTLAEALDVLHGNEIAVAVFGLPDDQPNPLRLMDSLRVQYPMLPVLVVSYDLAGFDPAVLRYNRECTEFEAVELPARSVDLKLLVDLVIARYLDAV